MWIYKGAEASCHCKSWKRIVTSSQTREHTDFITDRVEGKVVFSQACVIHCVHKGGVSQYAMGYKGGVYPNMQWARCGCFSQNAMWQAGGGVKRAVRILLECIFVVLDKIPIQAC